MKLVNDLSNRSKNCYINIKQLLVMNLVNLNEEDQMLLWKVEHNEKEIFIVLYTLSMIFSIFCYAVFDLQKKLLCRVCSELFYHCAWPISTTPDDCSMERGVIYSEQERPRETESECSRVKHVVWRPQITYTAISASNLVLDNYVYELSIRYSLLYLSSETVLTKKHRKRELGSSFCLSLFILAPLPWQRAGK